MARLAYFTVVLALIGGTAWAAAGLHGERPQHRGGVGLVLIVALQR